MTHFLGAIQRKFQCLDSIFREFDGKRVRITIETLTGDEKP